MSRRAAAIVNYALAIVALAVILGICGYIEGLGG